MNIFYVRPAGSHLNAEDGLTYDTAWLSLSNVLWSGVDGVEVNAGDTLYVCGTYSTQFILGVTGSVGLPVTIRGDYPGDPGVFDGITGSGINIQNGYDYIILKSLSSINNTGNGIFIGNTASKTSLDITECVVSGNGNEGIQLQVIIDSAYIYTGITIDTCDISNNGKEGIRLGVIIGTTPSFRDITVTDNHIYDNNRGGIRIGNIGATTSQHEDIVITGNNVHDNGIPGGGGACSIIGFSSSTNTYGKNLIAYNKLNRQTGGGGGINPQYSHYFKIHNNECNDHDSNGGVDGNGILIDHLCTNFLVYSNDCNRNLGDISSDATSGMGIGVLDATDIIFYGNKGTGNRQGLHIGQPAPHTGTAFYNNTFLENTNYGFACGNGVNDDVIITQGNILTGTPTGTAYYVIDGVTDQTNESWNIFSGFGTSGFNHTLDVTDILIAPDIKPDYSLEPTSIGVGIGIKWWGAGPRPQDFDGKALPDYGIKIGAKQ